ncbi:hypothetical protein P8C59_009537 [Phyllachora maydis]|uniref:Integrase catalytic domain-containing protein n=1 Tax=Phyllachora maydis TaxID=1825666 RepID=A0AAD9MJV8_9PEZI|nr:hypothetical protein P8C59_009537 [Phyllachora maydis]
MLFLRPIYSCSYFLVGLLLCFNSKVIEVLKQFLKSHKRNISSTLASLTNNSNAAATRKTSYNPPIDTGSKEGFKDTITSSIIKELSKKAYTIPDDSKLSGESNFEQWIQALSIVLRALGISNFLENPDISNTYSDSDQAVLLMLLYNSLSSSPRAAISRPIESKKEDVYNEFHALTFSTYKKGLSAFNAEFNGYLAKLTMAKIDIDPSLILNQYFKALESKFPSWVLRQKSSIRQARMLGLTASSLNIEYLMADILEESRNPAIEAYRAAHVANSSNSTPNSNSNPSKKGKNKKKGKKKASYNIKGQNYSAKSAEQASFMLGSYNLAIEEEEESDSSSNSSSSSDSDTQLAQLLALKGYKKRKNLKGKGLKTSSNNKAKYKDNQPRRRPRDPALYNNLKKSGFFLDVKGSSKPILHANFAFPLGLTSYNTTQSIELQRNKIVVEIPSNSIRKEDYRPIIEDAIVSEAIEPNKRYKLRNSPAKGTTLEGIGPSLRGKRPRRPTREPEPLTGTRDLPRTLREPVIEGNKVEKAISSPTLKEPNIGQRDYYNPLNLAKLWHVRLGHIGLRLLKKTSSITKGLPNFDKIKEADFHCSSCDRGKAVRRVSKALIPDLPRVLDLIEGDTVKIRPRPYNRNPIVLLLVNRKSRGLRNGFGRYPTKFHFDGGTEITDLLTTWLAKRGIKFRTSAPYIHEQNGLVERSVRVILDQAVVELVNSTAITNKETTPFQAPFDELEPGIPSIPNLERYRAIGARGEAIIPLEKRSKSLKFTSRTEECKLLAVLGSKTYLVYIPSRRAVLKTSTVKFIEDNTVLSQPTNNTALEGELVDLDLDLEGAISPDPSNLNTEKPISIEIGPSKLEPYKSSSNKGDKMQLDYYKLLAKTSSYILSFVYKARKRVISKDSTPTTYKQVLKLPRDERSKWLEAITKEFIQLLELGVFKFLPRSLLPSNRKLITCRNVLKVKKDAKNRPIKYTSRLVARGFMQVEGLDYTVTYASTSIPPTWRILLAIGVFYNAKTCHFIVTYIDDCLFIGPNIGYITDLKKRLNKVYAIEDLGPAAYFLGVQIIRDRPNRRLWLNQSQYWLSRSLNRPTKSHLNAAKNLFKYLNSTKDYSICFSCNGYIVADLGPKLSNSSNTTTKLSRDFHSKEGPRPLTTTSTTIVDSRNSKGSSRTSIINSSLVPIGFSDSDFAGDKATSKSTYGYLYKLAGRPISWKTKRATTIALSTLEAETDGLIEAIREVQWIIGLFSKLHRPIDYPITLYGDNQGSITVANDPALHARTKHTLLKFWYVRE